MSRKTIPDVGGTGPIRTCVACGRRDEKHRLHRLVWAQDAPVTDASGSASGRGAYCCRDGNCLERFVSQKKKWKRVFRL